MLFQPVAVPPQMHIPDGFLSISVSIVLWALAILIVGYALRRVGKDLDERKAPMMGVLAACIFAGQMLNFTVAGGTSGHLMGAAIATILLGPWASIVVLTCVVSIQALIFQDGGLLALGGNIFNMAVVGTAVSFTAYRTIRRVAGDRAWSVLAGGFAAGWLSIVVAALGVALQLALSGSSRANIAIPAMGGVHALIGVGEGLITSGALAFVRATRRDLLKAGGGRPVGGRALWLGGLIVALALAIASPLASANPDGLEWLAQQQGFLNLAQAPSYQIIPDYALPGVSDAALATILAGVIGTLIVFGVALAIAYTRRSRRSVES
jgi:cobalt/nickel transport system permease protein